MDFIEFFTYSCSHTSESITLGCVIAGVVIGFIVSFIVCTIDSKNRDKNNFIIVMLMSLMGGLVLSFTLVLIHGLWSMLLVIVPVIWLLYALYNMNRILAWVNKKRIRVSKIKLKSTIRDLKAEELARQAYESLKEDFSNIKYQNVLSSIKKKMQ